VTFRLADSRIKPEWRRKYLAKRSDAQIRLDLVEAFDVIGRLKLKIWFLSLVVTAQTGSICWLATQLFSRLK
jgi:hypothetical protein